MNNISSLEARIAALSQENQILKEQVQEKKKFGLVWENKPDTQALKINKQLASLKKDETKTLIQNTLNTNHMLISGDNFHALTALFTTHKNLINVIYIDPPYNTGNKDFIYNDQYLDLTDQYHHSKWLSFMEKRLILAKELLADDGIIFVSIGHHEQARLKLLMDQIFLAKNEIGMFVWEKSSSSQSKLLNVNQEYILSYSKNKAKSKKWLAPRDPEIIKSLYEIVENENKTIDEVQKDLKTKIKQLVQKNPDENSWLINYVRVTENRKIFYGKDLSIHGKPNEIILKNGKKLAPLGNRKWQTVKRINQLIDDERIEWRGESGRPYEMHFLEESMDNIGSLIKNVSTRNGKEDLKEIFGEQIPFDYPKPKKLIMKLLEFSTEKDSIILDFFAGSGTTGHAIMEMNEKDQGTRQCILVTDSGKMESDGESAKNKSLSNINIAEDITYERLKRVITGENWHSNKKQIKFKANLIYSEVALTAASNIESNALEQNRLTDAHKEAISSLNASPSLSNKVSNKVNEIGISDIIEANVFAKNIL